MDGGKNQVDELDPGEGDYQSTDAVDEHVATQENVATLGARGVEFIGPESGMLACGYEGLGRLWKVDEIAFRAEFLLARQKNLIA